MFVPNKQFEMSCCLRIGFSDSCFKLGGGVGIFSWQFHSIPC